MEDRVVDSRANGKGKQKGKGAVELAEEAVHLLRLSPASPFLAYYTGSLPFVLGLLYFWADMSRNAYAPERLAGASLGLAVLFTWMKCWQSVFALQIRARISRTPTPKWSFHRAWRLVTTQALVQSTGFLILPLALIMLLPFGWAYSFFQSVLAQEYGDQYSMKAAIRRSLRLSSLWPEQNHILLGVLLVFGLFVFLNLCVAILAIPYLLKKLLGVETVFSLGGMAALNTTFLAAALGLTYLCADPIVKTAYALRCFYGVSLETGDDIKASLRMLFSHTKKMAAAIILVICASSTGGLATVSPDARFVPDLALGASVLTPQQLDEAIAEAMTRREFTWRLPRERPIREADEAPGLFRTVLEWTGSVIMKVREILSRLFDQIQTWWKRLSPQDRPVGKSSGSDWRTPVQALLLALLCVAACLGAVFLWRLWKRRKRTAAATVEEIAGAPDLTKDDLRPDLLPVDRWMSMAKQFIAEGSPRLAMRAVYLATLAHLAEKGMVLLAQYKSNRDYESELKRRAREHKELISSFSANVRSFDRAWYGMYAVNQVDMDRFSSNHERIIAVAD